MRSAISRRQKKKELLASGKSAGQGGKPTKREIEKQEKKNMVNYEDIEKFDVATVWGKLNWTLLQRRENHFLWKELDGKPGLYRVRLLKRVDVKHSFSIGEQEITVSALEKDAILSIGKTKNLKQRLSRQHFSGNISGNRLGRHLAKIYDNKADYLSLTDIFKLNEELVIEYVIEWSWWKRDLLESYGKVHHKCLFDLGVKH